MNNISVEIDSLLIPPKVQAPLEKVLANDLLESRPVRSPNYKAEAEGLVALSESLADSTETILQKLSEMAMTLCGADSAGVSILETENGTELFRWRGVAGKMSTFLNGTMPREYSPCGHVLKTQTHHLMVNLIRHYQYVNQIGIPMYEALLIPFMSHGIPVGTVWALAHSHSKKFDLEDLRLLKSLSHFAAVAYQSKQFEESERQAAEARQHAEIKLRAAMTEAERARDEEYNAKVKLEAINKRLQEEAKKLQNVLDNMPMLAALLNPKGEILLINRIAASIQEDPIADMIGIRGEAISAWRNIPESQAIVREALKQAQNGNSMRVDLPYMANIRSKPERRWIDLVIAPVFDDDGNVVAIVKTGSDITERKNLEQDLIKAKEEAELANKLKSAFLANMSHEIRTPLGAMLGFADFLKDPNISPEERTKFADTLCRNGEQLSYIINDILDLSKVEAGHLTLECKPVSPAEIASEVVSLLDVKAKEKNLTLDYQAHESTPDRIVTDEIRLRQILVNIVGNALKFTHRGSVVIRSYSCDVNEKPGVAFEVQDTGIGISRTQKEQLFERFVQGDGSITRQFGGTGLGLALSRRLARALGGEVSILSTEEGAGTTFKIVVTHMPATFEGTTEGPARKAQTEPPANALRGLQVLVVDDAPDNQLLIRRHLTKRGATVESADNGLEGYRKALIGNYNIILMDLQMPHMDGYTATQKLRMAGYQKPIIALTAHAMTEVRRKCLDVGCNDHLSKPINSKELISVIAAHARVEH